ncbi:MAG: hypothetical protein AAFN94_04935 [Pseudomonadota bacterium]
MKSAAYIMMALLLGAGCTSVPDKPSSNFPPIGLAATARWLETDGGLLTAAQSSADRVRREEARLEQLRSGTTALPASSVAVPDRTRPTSTIGRATQAFVDICAASLPSMANVTERFRLVNQRDFGAEPGELGPLLVGGEQPGNIYINLANGAGRSNLKQCAVSVRGENPSAAAQAFVDTTAAAGIRLEPVQAVNAQRAWRIVGAPAGTQLKINSRRNILGQQLTGAWIIWP